MENIIFVEGKTDKQALILAGLDANHIICTYGTVSLEQLEKFIEEHETKECYFLFDEDYSGDKLRKQFIAEFPNGTIIRIPPEYKEVATTPVEILTNLLKEYYLL